MNANSAPPRRPTAGLAGPLFGILSALLLPAAAGAAFVGISTVRSQYFEKDGLNAFYGPVAGDHFAWAVAAGDFNGDGVGDLATGIPHDNGPSDSAVADAGAVIVRYGLPGKGLSTDLASTVLTRFQPGSLEPPGAGDELGYSLAAGDFNGDGIDDLAVGVPGDSEELGVPPLRTHRGAVEIHYGGPAGIEIVGEQVLVDGGLSGARRAMALAVGNFDADGYDDLAVGSPLDYSYLVGCTEVLCTVDHAGTVFVYYGSAGGLAFGTIRYIDQNEAGIPDVVDPFEEFGYSLAAGNFNGDHDEFGISYDDLAIGVPSEDSGGAVLTILGSGDGLVLANSVYLSQWDLFANFETGDRFGHSLAAGDFDHDGNDDLAVGVPYEDYFNPNLTFPDDAGEVDVLYGTSSGAIFNLGRSQAWSQADLFDAGSTDDHYGFALVAADFGRDGYADLAIGIPGENFVTADSGQVFVYKGTPTGLDGTKRKLAIGADGVPGSAQGSQDTGRALAVGDFDGNGFPDLVIGAPYRNLTGANDAGGEVVVYGSLFADGFDTGFLVEWSSYVQ